MLKIVDILGQPITCSIPAGREYANLLWVRRDQAANTIAFDVSTSDGTLAATVMLRGVRTRSWSPFVVRGEVVLLVIVDADGVPQVGRFVIERGG